MYSATSHPPLRDKVPAAIVERNVQQSLFLMSSTTVDKYDISNLLTKLFDQLDCHH